MSSRSEPFPGFRFVDCPSCSERHEVHGSFAGTFECDCSLEIRVLTFEAIVNCPVDLTDPRQAWN
jgi:hypothetical protein